MEHQDRAPKREPEPDDRPVLPSRSIDETDIGWGDRRDPDDEDRYLRDRPPHWDTP
jgi:hypothetical protein